MAKCKCVFAIPLMGLHEGYRVINVCSFCAIFVYYVVTVIMVFLVVAIIYVPSMISYLK